MPGSALGPEDSVANETMSDLVEFVVLREDRQKIITFTNNRTIANYEMCHEGQVWGIFRPMGHLIFFWEY